MGPPGRENAGEVGVHNTLRNLQDPHITAFANSFGELVEDE